MKKFIFFGIFALLLSMCSKAQFTKASLQATGLTCALCSNAINKAVSKLSFVESVKSDIKNSSFAIVFKANASIEFDDIKKAVEDAGFSIGGLNVTGNFDNITVEKDKHVQIGTTVFHFLNNTEQVLSGEKTVVIVDKDYLSPKQFKKMTNASKMSCVQTGKASGDCCTKDGIKEGTRIYHVTI
jgi:copper chaperone CopZ